jgi:hypothetical protein
MSYQTGTATSPVNLLQTIVTWLVSIGWTQDMSQADGTGSVGWRAHLHKGTNYVNLRAVMNESSGIWAGGMYSAGYGICMYLGTGFSSAAAWNAQAGGPIGSGQTYTLGVGFSLPSGAIQNYYFFGDATGDNIVIVVEKTPSIYQHMGWGLSLVKAGAWTGGPYFFGSLDGYYVFYTGAGPGNTLSSSCPGCDADYVSCQNCFIRIDVDTFTGKWIGVSPNTGVAQGYTGKLAASSVMPAYSYGARTIAPRFSDNTGSLPSWQNNQTSSADSRANLLPVHLWAVRDAGQMSLIGWIPNVFCTNGVGNGFSNASEYVLGPTTYKMFPNFAVVKQ